MSVVVVIVLIACHLVVSRVLLLSAVLYDSTGSIDAGKTVGALARLNRPVSHTIQIKDTDCA